MSPSHPRERERRRVTAEEREAKAKESDKTAVMGMPNAGSRSFKATPPDKGSFPLDHEGPSTCPRRPVPTPVFLCVEDPPASAFPSFPRMLPPMAHMHLERKE